MKSELIQIGNITSGYRQIKNSDKYDIYFKSANNTDRIIIPNGEVEDTVELMKKVVFKYIDDTKQIAQILRTNSIENTCKNIWNFLYHHIQYKLDKSGIEQLRRPVRSWQEKNIGIDCDCFSIFVSSILTNLKIPHFFRITKYDRNVYQHVYVIAQTPKGEYIIDCVLSKPNYEKPFTQKKDFNMSLNGINIAVLDGVQENDFINDIINDSNIGSLLNENDVNATYNYLLQTREIVANNPTSIMSVEDPKAFLEMLDYAIKYWNTPNRKKALDILIENEEKLNKANGLSNLEGLESDFDNDWSNLDNLDNEEILDYIGTLEEQYDSNEEELDNIEGFGSLGKGKAERTAKRDERKTKRKELKAEKKEIKKTTKGKEQRQAMKDFRKENKRGFFRAVGQGVKQGAKALIKFNPLTVTARNGFLLALKLNLFKIAQRLKWGYATAEQAKGKIDSSKHQKSINALKKIEDLYVKKLQGNKEKLKKAILTGKSGGLNGIPDNYFNENGFLGDPASGTMITAAAAIIASVAKILKSAGLTEKGDPESEADISKEIENININAEELKTLDMDNETPSESVANNSDNSNNQSDGKITTFLKNNPLLVVGGLLGLGTIAYLVFKPKDKELGKVEEKTTVQNNFNRTRKRRHNEKTVITLK